MDTNKNILTTFFSLFRDETKQKNQDKFDKKRRKKAECKRRFERESFR
jgi:hypothetical protein